MPIPYLQMQPKYIRYHDDVIKWKHFPRNWPFVREIHRSPVNFLHKGQWRGALMFTLIYAWINDWVNNREAGDLRRQHGHYDVIVMIQIILICRPSRSMIYIKWITRSMHGHTLSCIRDTVTCNVIVWIYQPVVVPDMLGSCPLIYWWGRESRAVVLYSPLGIDGETTAGTFQLMVSVQCTSYGSVGVWNIPLDIPTQVIVYFSK